MRSSCATDSPQRDQIAHPLNGFGCVAPLVENRNVLSISFSSVKFPGRAPDDKVLLRAFVGGACQPHLIELPDDELLPLVQTEMQELLGARGEPIFTEIVRWRRAMPQDHVGHLEGIQAIEERTAGHRGLELAGNAYRDVGIPYCLRSGEAAAQRITDDLRAL